MYNYFKYKKQFWFIYSNVIITFFCFEFFFHLFVFNFTIITRVNKTILIIFVMVFFYVLNLIKFILHKILYYNFILFRLDNTM